MAMKTQTDLIGAHPAAPNIIGVWLDHNDTAITATKRHRALTQSAAANRKTVIDWFAIHEHPILRRFSLYCLRWWTVLF